jgi:hypothetical protein
MKLSEELLRKVEIKENADFIQVSVFKEITNEENQQLEQYGKNKGRTLRMTLANLTNEQRKSLEEMRSFVKEMESIPESEKEPIPEKILDRWQSEVG